MIEFTSLTKSHILRLEIDKEHKQALINDISIDYHSPVELAVMIKQAATQLKLSGIDEIIQQVQPDDWKNILINIKEFRYINKNEQHNFFNIACNVDDFPVAFMKGIGYTFPFV